MKSIEELRQFFEKEIKPNLHELEEKRKKASRNRIIGYFLLGIPSIAIIYFLILCFVQFFLKNSFEEKSSAVVGFIILLCLLIASHILWRIMILKRAGFRHEFKQAVINQIIQFIDPSLKYNPADRKISGQIFLESKIFPPSSFYPDSLSVEDYVQGELGQTKFEFFEIIGSTSYTETLNKETITQRVPFIGLFFTAEFNKSFKGSTLVLPEDNRIRPQWPTATGREPVRLEDPEFEKHFAVYSTDQITARYILSTALMKRITDYKNKVDRAIHISFINNKIFVAIAHKKNLFEINIHKSLYDFENIREYYNDFRIALDIIEDLNLNTKIWLKKYENQAIEMPELSTFTYKKSTIIYILLAMFFGIIGFHNFYAGYKIRGAIKLGLTIFFILSTAFNLLSFYVLFVLFFVWIWALLEGSISVDRKGYPMK